MCEKMADIYRAKDWCSSADFFLLPFVIPEEHHLRKNDAETDLEAVWTWDQEAFVHCTLPGQTLRPSYPSSMVTSYVYK